MRLTKEMRKYWEWFGRKRFTRRDLWRMLAGRYQNEGGADPWPNDDFMKWLDIPSKKWICPAPGPRGGEGWRIADKVADLAESEELRKEKIVNDAEQTVKQAKLRIGELELLLIDRNPSDWKIMWHYKPPVALPGHDVDGRWRSDPCSEFTFFVPIRINISALNEQIERAEAHIQRMISERMRNISDELTMLELVFNNLN